MLARSPGLYHSSPDFLAGAYEARYQMRASRTSVVSSSFFSCRKTVFPLLAKESSMSFIVIFSTATKGLLMFVAFGFLSNRFSHVWRKVRPLMRNSTRHSGLFRYTRQMPRTF